MTQPSLIKYSKQNVTINGTRAFQETVHASSIRIFGNSKFQNGFIANKVSSHGSFKTMGRSVATELKIKGHGQAEQLQTSSMHVIGSFVANRVKAEDNVEVKGSIHITEALEARNISIRLHRPCRIAHLFAENTLNIEADRLSLLRIMMLRKLRGRCVTLRGCNVKINDVDASYVIGEYVEVGANCVIDTLIYSKTLAMANGATVRNVTHIPDQEKIWEMEL